MGIYGIGRSKIIAVSGVFIALLVGSQYALSFVAGVEIVTVLLLSYCFVFGVKNGIIVATAFSVIRCFLFGFYPTVIILYLIYYNLFALFFGYLGKVFNATITKRNFLIIIISAVVFTATFTLLDDVITSVFYGFNYKATKAYFLASVPTATAQCVCALITATILFVPITKTLLKYFSVSKTE